MEASGASRPAIQRQLPEIQNVQRRLTKSAYEAHSDAQRQPVLLIHGNPVEAHTQLADLHKCTATRAMRHIGVSLTGCTGVEFAGADMTTA